MSCVVRWVSVVVFGRVALIRVVLLPVMVDVVVVVVMIVAGCGVDRLRCLPSCSAACVADALLGRKVLMPAAGGTSIAEKMAADKIYMSRGFAMGLVMYFGLGRVGRVDVTGVVVSAGSMLVVAVGVGGDVVGVVLAVVVMVEVGRLVSARSVPKNDMDEKRDKKDELG